MRHSWLKSIGLSFFFVVLGACSRDDGVAQDTGLTVDTPDEFARFINPVAGLAAGRYTVVAAVDNAGDSGDFVLTIDTGEGDALVHSDSWSASVSERTFAFFLTRAGGVRISLSSPVENNLRLQNENGFVIAADGTTSTGDALIDIAASQIDNARYGRAYYAAIDPNDEKDTLEKWKVANGYYEALAAGRVLEPRFRDTRDLGYGRGVRLWTRPDGSVYTFVENFQVRTLPGQEYTRLNLDALLADDRVHHFGTNAIEFSTYPYGAGEPDDKGSTRKFAKFYTFDATRGNQRVEDHASEVRLETVDLDGRGQKAMPGACVYCHGGTLRPLRADGSFRDNTLDGTAGNGLDGDTNAKMQLLDASSFEYGDFSPFTRAEQEPVIKRVNQILFCTYPNLSAEAIQAACTEYCVDPSNPADCDGKGTDIVTLFSRLTGNGQWSGAFAGALAIGSYDDPAQSGLFDSATYRDDFVPAEWQPDVSDGNPPAGSDQLFLDVVKPYCLVCHSRRGTNLGANSRAGVSKDIDFSSYEKFIGHAEQIRQYVFERGVMPLSLRGFDAFWEEGGDAPEVLATYLNSVLPADRQIPFDEDGKVAKPGEPLADAGPDRTSTAPVRLSGANSRFVNRYQWRIVSQPDGSDATLDDSQSVIPLLRTSVDGDYLLELDASLDGVHDTDTVLIKIDSAMSADPKKLTFENDIRPIFSAPQDVANSTENDTKACDECHQASGGSGAIDGVPVFWRDAQPASGENAANAFYREVRSRIDFRDPANSPILTKPANQHHFGGLREGFEVDNPANRQNYDTMLNWILEGAVEK